MLLWQAPSTAANALRVDLMLQGDAGREKLERQVLSREQGLAASLRWRVERDAAAVEAAGAWLPAPGAAAAAEAGGGGASDASSDSDVDMDGTEHSAVAAGAAGPPTWHPACDFHHMPASCLGHSLQQYNP